MLYVALYLHCCTGKISGPLSFLFELALVFSKCYAAQISSDFNFKIRSIRSLTYIWCNSTTASLTWTPFDRGHHIILLVNRAEGPSEPFRLEGFTRNFLISVGSQKLPYVGLHTSFVLETVPGPLLFPSSSHSYLAVIVHCKYRFFSIFKYSRKCHQLTFDKSQQHTSQTDGHSTLTLNTLHSTDVSKRHQGGRKFNIYLFYNEF